ncbi:MULTISPECIES: DUF3800 domain-containing protein [Sphingobium]|uniref:DUF3800 domain-containing protein n=1 Tax=Sphingobium TaxID=165695 RepID=UPI000C06DBF4|nr:MULTISPECIES: DUF3800 domain-containing protein [Sphingobium]
METQITVYIDEGGDPGVKDGLKFLNSPYEWFTLGAYVTRSTRHNEPVDLVKDILSLVKGGQSPTLHYAQLGRHNRLPACRKVARSSARAFCFASHKRNLREYHNDILGHLSFGQFYNWCTRLLLERVMFWYEGMISAGELSLAPMRIIFSHRGGHDYDHMFRYLFGTLVYQAEHGKFKKPPKAFNPTMMKAEFASHVRHEELAGLQLADVVASAFFQATNTVSPNFALEPARALSPIMAEMPPEVARDVGVTVWPLAHQAHIPQEARQIYEHYGYKFGKLAGPGQPLSPVG